MSVVIRGATLPDDRVQDVRVSDGRIDAVGTDLRAEHVIPAADRRLLPGMVDVHVHFREPGAAHKETWRSGSQSAAAGGVTTVVDQPNTNPPTVDGQRFDEKLSLAHRSVVDFGINGGVTPAWDPASLFDRPLFALGEVFLADSTGEMGIDRQLFVTAVERAAAEGTPVTVHAEAADHFDISIQHRRWPDEADAGRHDPTAVDADPWSAYRTPAAEVAAIETAIDVAEETGAQVHIAHASTPAGIDAADAAGLTCEVTPHHLLLSREDLDRLGTFGRMNPPLRDADRQRAVFERVASPDGPVDVVATDHAPHTRAEKAQPLWDAPSGVPGVETALPLLLAAASRDRIGYERIRDLTARNPARIFDLPRKGLIEPGRDADLVLVDPDHPRPIRGETLHTACDWTPFEGWDGVFPCWTMVRGQIVYATERARLPAAVAPDGQFATVRGENVRATATAPD